MQLDYDETPPGYEKTMTKYSWLDVALWIVTILLLMPLLLRLAGSVRTALGGRP